MDITAKDLEKALQDKAFTLHYQPKINFLTGRVSGAEALVRWDMLEKGLVPPDVFIPLAEETGLITEITAQLIPIAIQSIQTLKANGFEGSIAVNTSPMDFGSDGILQLIQSALDNRQITPDDLQIELTETATLKNKDSIIGRLNDLTAMGLKLVMDDFGTGYSSIDLLSQLPFSALKIDQGVIGRMSQSTKNLNLVNMIINMARTLRMHVVAEGIEDRHAYRFLVYAGCMEAQGYWISKPLPFDAFQTFVGAKPQYPSSHLGMIYHAHLNNVYFRKSVLDAVLYANCGIKEDMASVTRPDIYFKPEKTRLGQWYFGAGQELSNRTHFKAIEAPHRKMHELGERLFMTERDDTNQLILEFNQAFEQVNQSLHLLEAELIAEEPCRIWHGQGIEGRAS